MLLPSIWFLLLVLPMLQAPQGPGTKITVQNVINGFSSERTTYIQGDRQRSEYRNSYGGRHGTDPSYGPRLAHIVRCDLGQFFELNLDTSEYTSTPYPPKPLTAEEIKARGLEDLASPQSAPPTVRVEIKTDDTGERKKMFGHTARHVIATKTQTPLEGSQSEPQQSITEGWYIDFDQRLSCAPQPTKGTHGYMGGYFGVVGGKRPMEKPEFVYIGEPETGFPLALTVTSKSSSTLPDAFVSTFETRVTEFVERSLDPALFEVPPASRSWTTSSATRRR